MPKRISDRFFLLSAPPRRGGQSEVHKAFDRANPEGGFAAIKLLRPHDDESLRSDGGEAIRIFMERETDALKALHHPNIVRMLDSGWDDEQQRYYVALEWVDRSLRDEIRDGQPMTWPVFLERIGKPLASALAYAHAREVEHRDVKPGNVLMDGGTLKLADFGISKMRSKVVDSDDTVARYRSNLYAPPEWESAVPYVRDVFSYGVLAVQLLSGNSAQDSPTWRRSSTGWTLRPSFGLSSATASHLSRTSGRRTPSCSSSGCSMPTGYAATGMPGGATRCGWGWPSAPRRTSWVTCRTTRSTGLMLALRS